MRYSVFGTNYFRSAVSVALSAGVEARAYWGSEAGLSLFLAVRQIKKSEPDGSLNMG